MPNIAPRAITFMVDLYEVYETTDAIFLVLEYASGGRLWDYVSTYLQQSPVHTNNNEQGIVPESSMHKASLTNVYSAKKVSVKKPSIAPLKTNLIEPTVTITTGATAASDDLSPAPTCPPSYIALFKNYLVTTVSKKEGCLAQCNIDNLVASDVASDVPEECTSADVGTKCPLNLTEDIPDLEYIDEPSPSCTDDSTSTNVEASKLKDNVSINDSGSANLEKAGDETAADKNTVDDIILNSKALMKDVDNALHAARRTSLNSPEQNIKEPNFISGFDESITAVKRSVATNLVTFTDSKDLKTFLSEDIGKSFLESSDKVTNKLQNFVPAGDEKSNTLTHFSSSTGTLDPNLAGRHGLTEMFNQLDAQLLAAKPSHLPETCVSRWGAEIVNVLDALHKLGIIWQDLNPDNILLGTEGHVLLTYQSQWNSVDNILSEEAKKNLYSAPEVGRVFPITPSCDWWSLGAILFELLTGKKLASCHPSGITSHTSICIPEFLTPEAKDILKQLLRYNDSERLGSGPHGVEDIKYHPFFHNVDWSIMNACC